MAIPLPETRLGLGIVSQDAKHNRSHLDGLLGKACGKRLESDATNPDDYPMACGEAETAWQYDCGVVPLVQAPVQLTPALAGA